MSGSAKARNEIDSFEEIYISIITWMEILVGAAEGDGNSRQRQRL